MGAEIQYRLIRSARKTISIEISRQGEVIVRSPEKMPKRQIDEFLREKEGWIRSHLEKLPKAGEIAPMTARERGQLAQAALEKIPTRVALYAPLVGVSYGNITIRAQRTRWGSCSGKGNLNFNFLLALAPEEVLDYVVVHELCHRLEMNHSQAFWTHVERVMPDYRIRKKWLKENGPTLMARL